MVRSEGFEPSLPGSQPGVIPLTPQPDIPERRRRVLRAGAARCSDYRGSEIPFTNLVPEATAVFLRSHKHVRSADA